VVTLRYLLYAAGVITVLALLAAVVPILIAIWAAVQAGLVIFGVGALVGFGLSTKVPKK